jgi:protein-S-isoprenylcysteine O-methyltransferase Ste14
VFPVVAAFVKDTQSLPKWWGILDVGIAFILVVLILMIQAFARDRVSQQAKESSYRAYRILLHGIFLMLLVFFIPGDRIIWTWCLIGFAWPGWLLFSFCLGGLLGSKRVRVRVRPINEPMACTPGNP